MKLSTMLILLTTFSTLSISSSTLAHSDRHSSYEINTYVIATRSGLARSYFSYGYDQRRAKNLTKYYRNNEQRHSRRHHNDHRGPNHSTYIILGHSY